MAPTLILITDDGGYGQEPAPGATWTVAGPPHLSGTSQAGIQRRAAFIGPPRTNGMNTAVMLAHHGVARIHQARGHSRVPGTIWTASTSRSGASPRYWSTT